MSTTTLKDLMAKRLQGANNSPQMTASANAKITGVEIITSRKGNLAIRVDFQQVSIAKQTLSVYFRTSDVNLLDGHRKKMNYLLNILGVVAPTNDTPILFIQDKDGNPVLLNGECKREELAEELAKMEAEYFTKQYVKIMDGDTRYRVLATVNTEALQSYLDSYAAKLKECVGKTIFLEINGKDSNNYYKTAFRAQKTA